MRKSKLYVILKGRKGIYHEITVVK